MDSDLKKISIAIATYNGASFVAELLDSLTNQTLPADEIIAVDDCSTDNTVNILREYTAKLPIKIFVNESNLGVNKNFEKAVKKCSGDYILICDQDDVWLKNNIEEKIKVIKKLPQNLPALIVSRSIVVNKNLQIIQNSDIRDDINNWKYLITKCFQGTTMAFNRKLVDLLPLQWPVSFEMLPYDYFLYLNALLTGNVYASKEKLMYYRTHGKNTSFTSSRIRDFVKSFFCTNKLYQDRITIRGLAQMNFFLKNFSSKNIILERQNVFEKIIDCRKDNKISWLKFFIIKDLPLSIRIRSFGGSLAFCLKEKV